MSKRPRDIGKIYLSGSKKWAIAKATKADEKKVKGTLDKFVTRLVNGRQTEMKVILLRK